MTQTIAQNIIINNKAKNRKNNYGKHPIEIFEDLDQSINNNNTYNIIQVKLDKLEANYNNTIEELDSLISQSTQIYTRLKQEQQLLGLLPTYTYNIPNKSSFLLLLKTINTLIEDCNKIINDILSKSLNANYIYKNSLIIEEVSSDVLGIPNKSWLFNYLITLNRMPTIKKLNSILICNSEGKIVWQ